LCLSCDSRSSSEKVILKAVRCGDTNLLARCVRTKAEANRLVRYNPFEDYRAPTIDIAIQYGRTDAVEFLLSRGASQPAGFMRGDPTPLGRREDQSRCLRKPAPGDHRHSPTCRR